MRLIVQGMKQATRMEWCVEAMRWIEIVIIKIFVIVVKSITISTIIVIMSNRNHHHNPGHHHSQVTPIMW